MYHWCECYSYENQFPSFYNNHPFHIQQSKPITFKNTSNTVAKVIHLSDACTGKVEGKPIFGIKEEDIENVCGKIESVNAFGEHEFRTLNEKTKQPYRKNALALFIGTDQICLAEVKPGQIIERFKFVDLGECMPRVGHYIGDWLFDHDFL